VDRNDGLVMLKENKTFRLAVDCQVIRWDDKEARIEDVRPGDKISVSYELPDDSVVAYRIRDESERFVGTIGAIDLPDGTVKARKEPFGEKEFRLARGCRILVNGKERKGLNHLDPGRQYVFVYRTLTG
jgi:hypothetical protein